MAVLQTYQVKTNAEDLTEIITNITPDDTPLLSSLASTKAYNTLHETQQDSLQVPTGDDSAYVEGADFTAEDHVVPERVPTYTQILKKHVHVSDTQLAVRTVGIKDLYAYETTKKMKELAMAIEWAGINGTGNSGASGQPRRMKGFLANITTNHLSGTGTGGSVLTEGMFNDLLQAIWSNGGKNQSMYCGGELKRQISGFTASTTKTIDANKKTAVAALDVYESDFGRVELFAHRYMPAKTLMVIQNDLWAWAWLRKTKHTPLAKMGDSTRGQIVAEVALESRQEKGNGKYTNVIRGVA